MFSDDIIETMCPETITYDKAREKMRRLWNLRTDRYDLAKKKRRLHTNNGMFMCFSFHGNTIQ